MPKVCPLKCSWRYLEGYDPDIDYGLTYICWYTYLGFAKLQRWFKCKICGHIFSE